MAEPRMTPSAILARLRRGFGRIRAGIARRWDRLRGRRPVTEGHINQERETRTSLGLMAQAAGAADPTPEQAIFLSQSIHGMRQRVAYLRGSVPNRSLAEERELVTIEAWLKAHEQGDAPPGWRPGGQPAASRPFLAASGGVLAALGGVRLWMVFAGLFAFAGGATAIQTARLNHAKHDLTEVRHNLQNAERALAEAREVTQQLTGLVRQADAQARESAETIERERRIGARMRQQLRRQIHDDETATRDRGEPIDWGLPVAGSGAQGDSN